METIRSLISMHLFIWMLCILSLNALPHSRSLSGEQFDQSQKSNDPNSISRGRNSAKIELRTQIILDAQIDAFENKKHAISASDHVKNDLGDTQSALTLLKRSDMEHQFKRYFESLLDLTLAEMRIPRGLRKSVI